ncbi:MAG: hypothetical protein U9N46_06135 [Euryarchaeota archaeon]|nr:MAG: hypothetical protein C5S47_05780 [ANME-2 cluster archaeon]MEA1864758.1 hypothetical protein [Euryarchaeota archaeon]
MELEFLNQNSGAFVVIFSAVVAIATMVYAVLTWRLVSETIKMRKVQTEPKISVTIQTSDAWINFIDMVIQNIGSGPAYNIKFKINPDFEYAKGKFLSTFGVMRSGFEYLAPNQKLQFFLTNMTENFREKVKTSFEIAITYQNISSKTYEDVYPIDFSHFEGLRQSGEPPLYTIAKNIENIQKDIHSLSTGFHEMRVAVRTKKDVEEEMEKLLEEDSRS